MKIDTAQRLPELKSTVAGMDENLRVSIPNYKRARALVRKITENIEACDDVTTLDEYWRREDLMLDALHLFDPHVARDLTDQYEIHRAALTASDDARRTLSGNPIAQAPMSQEGKQGEDYW